MQIESGYDHVGLLTAAGRLYFLGNARRHGLAQDPLAGDLAGPGRQPFHDLIAEQTALRAQAEARPHPPHPRATGTNEQPRSVLNSCVRPTGGRHQ